MTTRLGQDELAQLAYVAMLDSDQLLDEMLDEDDARYGSALAELERRGADNTKGTE